MSKKKQPKNGFFYFMLDMQQAFREQGRDVPMRDMSIFAGPSWSKLTDAQKQRYTLRAKEEKLKEKGKSSGEAIFPANVVRSQLSEPELESGKRNCTGSLVSDTFKTRNREQEKVVKECEDIRALFVSGRRVALQTFVFVDIQSLCDIPSKPDQKYLPCELAIVKYSISDGVLSKLHCFIKPGPIPIGFRYLVQSTAENTHQIPPDGGPDAVKDYRKLLGALEDFLREDMGSIPPLFAKRLSVDRVKWSLEWLADRAGVDNSISHIYEVENLLGQLTAHANSPKSPFVIEDLLKTSSYDHDECTRCNYHEERECSHCSLGICHTYCYVTSELLCPMYGVSLTRKHLPTISHEASATPPVIHSHRTRRPSDAESVSSRVSVDSVPVGLGRGTSRGRGRMLSAQFSPAGRGIGRSLTD